MTTIRTTVTLAFIVCAAVFASAGCDSSRKLGLDGGRDGARDMTARDTRLAEASLGDTAGDTGPGDSGPGDGAPADTFPAVLEGLWLVGWSGGMNHFSWVRFAKLASPSAKAQAWILDGKTITGNLPFWNCSGETTWWMGAAAFTAYLDFPTPSCDPRAPTTGGYVFSDFAAPTNGPKGAILMATVKEQATLTPFSGFKYPSNWCDATLTSCKSPF